MARECVNEYLETVGGQIRWRRARRLLLRELSDHIADQAAAFEAEGRSPEEALAGAVAEMGEPEAVGRELDRLHRPRNRWGLAITVAALFAAGMLLQLFAAELVGDAKDVFYFRRQVLGLLLAAGVLAGLWFSDYTLLLRRKWVPAAALLLLCLGPILTLPLFPSDFYLNYQRLLYPTLLLPVPYAGLVASLRGKGPLAVLLCGTAVLALPFYAWLAPNSASWLVSAASMLLVLLAAVGLGWFRGKRRWNLLAALGPALILLPLLLLRHSSFLSRRLSFFLHPEADPLGSGWLYTHLRAGVLPSCPHAYSDPELLLLETAQGLGRWVFWAAAGLIVLFAALLVRRIRALHSRMGKLLALSAFLPLFLQAAIYWLYNQGWWPLGVLSLPFLSYGVFFLLVDAALAGVLLSVFRMDALVRDTAWASSAPAPRPSALDIPLGRGQLHIEYRKGTQHF